MKYLETSLEHFFPHNPRSEVALVVHLRMLNPPMLLEISAAKIDRIWRVAHVVPPTCAKIHAPTVTGYRVHP